MRKLIIIVALTALLFLLLNFMPKLVSHQFEARISSGFNYAPGKIVIQFTQEVSPVIPRKEYGIIQTGIAQVDELCQLFRVHTMVRQFPAPIYPTPDLTGYFVVKFDESTSLDQVVDSFSNVPSIEKVEKVGVHKYIVEPNDDKYPQQWHLNQTNDCDIDAPEAWNIQKGSKSVKLTIADSGVHYAHPDLNNNIWKNGKELRGDPEVDDDGNGYIDDVYGWDFDCDQEDCYPNGDPDPSDTYGHGTHCAGIAAAETNNDTGVAGIAGGWYPGQKGCKIMCLCIGHETADMSMAASAIQYATDKGATAINCSWESSNTGGLEGAVNYAVSNGVLVVTCAGNYNGDYCSDTQYYYLTTREDVMVVGATDQNDQKAIFSNYGDCLDVAAPGTQIMSTCVSSCSLCDYKDYYTMSGTSMAAPMVVGLAGLIKSKYPDWKRDEIWYAIVEGADDIGVPDFGSGRINANNTLRIPEAPSNLSAYGYCWEVELTWQDNSNNEDGFRIYRKSGPNWYPLDYVGPNITIYWDIDLWCGMVWCYKVRAYNQHSNSDYSKSACAKTTSCYYCDPWDFKITPDKEIINPEESITYTYELKNKGNVDLIDIELIDYEFGVITTKFTLKKGETRNFTKTVTLTETTTNFAEATAKYHHEGRIVSVKTNAQATVEVRK